MLFEIPEHSVFSTLTQSKPVVLCMHVSLLLKPGFKYPVVRPASCSTASVHCSALALIRPLSTKRLKILCMGRHTFNTPAPLLQELGLNNNIHTWTAVLWNTREIMEHTGNHGTHGKSGTHRKPTLSLGSCYPYTSNNTKYVHNTLKVDQATRLYLCTQKPLLDGSTHDE